MNELSGQLTREFSEQEQGFMQRALDLADLAREQGEVPVGAVLVEDGKVIGEGFNAPISTNDASAHAEIKAIRSACQTKNNYRLPNTQLFVTLEPCAMCAGALIHARVKQVIIAAAEPRAGAAGSALNVLQNEKLNHRCQVEFGLLGEQSAQMLKSFFKSRRVSALK